MPPSLDTNHRGSLSFLLQLATSTFHPSVAAFTVCSLPRDIVRSINRRASKIFAFLEGIIVQDEKIEIQVSGYVRKTDRQRLRTFLDHVPVLPSENRRNSDRRTVDVYS